MILSITGPSGVGKTTLLHNLITRLPEAKPLESLTTRQARESDEPGEYNYVSREEFEALAARGEFLWEARTTNNLYGTRKAAVDEALNAGFYVPILVIDAAEKLFEYAKTQGKENSVRFMYIRVMDEAELRNRFKERGDAQDEVEARIAQCRSWDEQAAHSRVPFHFLNGADGRKKLLQETLEFIANFVSKK